MVNKKYEIAHIITSLDSGGAEKMLFKLLIERKKNGYCDIVISLKSHGVIQENFVKEGITVINLGINGLPSFFRSLYQMRYIIRDYDISLFQTWLYHADFFGSIISLIYRKKIIWNIRCSVTRMKYTTKLILSLLKVMSFYVPKKIIYASQSGKISHHEFGFDRSKAIVIPNGFDLQNRIKHYKKEEDKFVVGSIGRFHQDKDYETLIKASAIVLTVNPKTTFVLVGNDLDVENEELINLLGKYKVKSSFLLLGFQENVNDIYGMFDIYCSSSKSEGFPNVIGEAMMHEIPVVSTDAGDSKFLIGNAGEIVPIEDSQSLATAINNLISMSSIQRARIGKNGFLRISEHFKISEIMNKYNDLYKSVTS